MLVTKISMVLMAPLSVSWLLSNAIEFTGSTLLPLVEMLECWNSPGRHSEYDLFGLSYALEGCHRWILSISIAFFPFEIVYTSIIIMIINNNDNTNINYIYNYIYMFLIVVIYIVQVFLCLSSSGHADSRLVGNTCRSVAQFPAQKVAVVEQVWRWAEMGRHCSEKNVKSWCNI